MHRLAKDNVYPMTCNREIRVEKTMALDVISRTSLIVPERVSVRPLVRVTSITTAILRLNAIIVFRATNSHVPSVRSEGNALGSNHNAMGKSKRKQHGANREMDTSGDALEGNTFWSRDCVTTNRNDSETIPRS